MIRAVDPVQAVVIRRATSSDRPTGWGRMWSLLQWPVAVVVHACVSAWTTARLLFDNLNYRKAFERSIVDHTPLAEYRDFSRVRHLTKCPVLMSAVCSHPRNDDAGLFCGNKGAEEAFVQLLQGMFPGHRFYGEDILLFCSRDQAIKYRAILDPFLQSLTIPSYRSAIRAIVDSYLERLRACEVVNATTEARNFAVDVIAKVIMGGTKTSYSHIADGLKIINQLFLKLSFRCTISETEQRRYTQTLSQLGKALLAIYNDPERNLEANDCISRLKADASLTQSQRLSLFFVMFLAGEETTRELLTYLVWQVSQRRGLQDAVYTEICGELAKGLAVETCLSSCLTLQKIIKEGIRLFPPAYSLPRIAGADLIVEMQTASGVVLKRNVARGESINPCPAFAARDRVLFGPDPDAFRPERHADGDLMLPWLPFGSGFHACPGQWLAREEIKLFLAILISRYRFEWLEPHEKVEQVGSNTLQLSRDILIFLTKR